MSGDLVAVWDVPLPDGKHKVEFEHGTTTGKRIIRVDKQVSFSAFISSSQSRRGPNWTADLPGEFYRFSIKDEAICIYSDLFKRLTNLHT